MGTEQIELGANETSGEEANPEPADDTGESTSTDDEQHNSGPPSNIAEENLAKHTAEDAVEQWANEMADAGEHYAYAHLQVKLYQDLTGKYWGINLKRQKKVIDNDRNAYGGYWKGISPDGEDVVPALIGWIAETLAVPYLPPETHDYPFGYRIRAVPIENIRIFASDGARECFREKDIPIDDVERALEQCAEIRPPETYIQTFEKYLEAKETKDQLGTRVHRLKREVRNRFPCLATHSPDPVPKFEGLSETELKEELEVARKDEEAAKERRDQLREELSELQDQYRSQIYRWFEDEIEALQPDGQGSECRPFWISWTS
jgi:hypothetical protein